MRISDWSSDVCSSDLHEQFGDRVLILGRHARTALAAASLGAEALQRGALEIALHRDGDDPLLPLDQRFIVYAVGVGGDFRQARGGEVAFDRLELLAHHRTELQDWKSNTLNSSY